MAKDPRGRKKIPKRDQIVFIRFGVPCRHRKVATLEAAAISNKYRKLA